MYKLLLVDDETSTREGILKNIQWTDIGIQEVRTAKNGIHGLEVAKNFIPDILLTDIKMPRMNGIDLCYKIKELNPDCSILIMSGYSEVDYLKSAIHLSALNFVDKPIDLDKLKEWIEQSVAVQHQIRINRIYQENSKWLMKTDIALGLIRKADPEKYIPAIKELYPQFNLDSPCVCILLKAFPQDFLEPSNKIDINEIAAKASRHFEGKSHPFVLAPLDNNTLVLLLLLPNHSMNYDTLFHNLFQELNQTVHSLEWFMTVGKMVNGIKHLYQSYETALLALEMLFFSRERRLIQYQKEPAHTLTQNEMNPWLDSFLAAITNADMDGAVRQVDNAVFQISMHSGTEKNTVINFFFRMILELIKKKARLSTTETSSSKTNYAWSWITRCDFLSDISHYVKDYIGQYFDEIYRINSTTPMDKVLSIIHQDYSKKDLTLASISHRTFLSPSYLCSKFKEVTGETLIRYLTDYRIAQSLELLKNKNYKINDIAERVGFSNGNYYAKIFRNRKGMTPLEYRQQFIR